MRIAFLGNCQALSVAATFRLAAGDGVECRGFEVPRGFGPADAAWITEADVVFEQPVELKRSGVVTRQARGRVVRMPLLAARFLWPFAGAGHPRNAETVAPWLPDGRYSGQVVDDQLRALIDERGTGPDSPRAEIDGLVADYLALDFARRVDLDAMLEQDRLTAGRLGGELGARMADLIVRDFRTQRLFLGADHLAGPLVQRLVCELGDLIELPIAPAAAEAAWFRCYGGDDPPLVMAPVHPSVLRHFDIKWAGEPARFRWYYDGMLTAEEIAERAVRLADDEASAAFHRAEASNGTGIAAITALLPRYRGSPWFRIRLARQLGRTGRPLDSAAEYAEAARLLPPQDEALRGAILRHVAETLAHPPTAPRPRIAYDVPFVFAADGSGVPFLDDGWFAPEDWGSWLRGHTGRLRFALPSAPREGLRLDLSTAAYLDRAGQQSVRVFVNGREMALWRFEKPGFGDAAIEVGHWAHDAGEIEVAFFVAQPTQPAENGSTDTRPLGFGLRSLTVRPL